MADPVQHIADAPVADRSLGFWVKCAACAHCWIAAYYPAPLTEFARIARRSICPKCGGGKAFVAKQSNGELQEEREDG